MVTGKNKGILVVSFGTSHPDTCKKTIEAIENEIHNAYPEYPVYRAWTSGMICRKIEKRDGIHIFSVSEALEQMKKDGIIEVVIQPTHVLNGIENTLMEQTIDAARMDFVSITVGTPLLTTQEDSERVVDFLIKEWHLADDECLICMGHGTEHHSNFVYAALNYQLAGRGVDNMVMGTVEGYPTVEDVLAAVKKINVKRIVLTPFMIVAGDHACNDLAGDEEDSWKSIFEREGYEVRCALKGLGEYKEIRRMFVEHLNKAMRGDID